MTGKTKPRGFIKLSVWGGGMVKFWFLSAQGEGHVEKFCSESGWKGAIFEEARLHQQHGWDHTLFI